MYLPISCYPCKGCIFGVVVVHNACATLAILISIFDQIYFQISKDLIVGFVGFESRLLNNHEELEALDYLIDDGVIILNLLSC